MPQNVTVLKVFVASPSDVSEERNSLETVVNEVNSLVATDLNLRLELVKWETDVYPSFASYPQEVINEQIGKDYDIFIGILWSKIGTPTPESSSGTIEEFEIAFQKHEENPRSINLMIYFKHTPINPAEININQLEKIGKFRSSLGKKGGLYWTFDTSSEFETILRSHLGSVIREWKEKLKAEPNQNSDSADVDDIAEKFDAHQNTATKLEEAIETANQEVEYGIFDYLDIYEARVSEFNLSLGVISSATEKIGKRIRKRSRDLDFGNSNLDQDQIVAFIKKMTKLVSADLNRYSNTLNQQLPIFSASAKDSFQALSMYLLLAQEFNNKPDEILTQKKQLIDLLTIQKESYESMSGFKSAVSKLPKLSAKFNRAKKNVVISLDLLLSELSSIGNITETMIDSVSEFEGVDNLTHE